MGTILKIIVLISLVFGVNCLAKKKVILNENDFPELKYLNESVNPCDDFYEFTCGNYKNVNPRPPTEKLWDSYTQLQRQIDRFSKSIVQSEKRATDHPAIKRLKDIYNSCIKYTDNDNGVEPMANFLNQFGGWLLLDDNLPVKDFSWKEVGEMIAKSGLPLLFSWSIMPYLYDANQNMIYLSKDSLLLPSANIISTPEDLGEELLDIFSGSDSNKRSAKNEDIPYIKYLLTIAEALCENMNCQKSTDELRKGLYDVLNIMQHISGSQKYPMRNFNYSVTISSVKDLQDFTDSFSANYTTKINWLEYFRIAFSNPEITAETKVYCLSPNSVANILELVEHTDTRIMRNFMMARLVTYMAPDSNQKMWEAYNNLYKQQYQDKYPVYDREGYCQQKILKSQMVFALSSGYSDYFFGNIKDKIKTAQSMIQDLKDAFQDLLNENTWMDKDAKKAVKKKLKQIINLLAFPDFVLKDNKLRRYFGSLDVCRHDHFGNMQRLRAFNLRKTCEVVGQKRDRYAWTNSPMQVNAFYNPSNNRIVLPAAIMNEPFYYGNFSIMDYGRVGSIIGHEITHAFDSRGKIYDGIGNMFPIFSQNVTDKFNELSSCFVDQYSKYYIPEIEKYVNGTITLKENIADNGGLRETYRAFLKVYDRKGLDFYVKKYDTKQLFFIAFGTNWCKTDTKESLTIMQGDEHAPNRYRVRGPVSNMKEFSEVFNCPKGSPMNPDNKCVLW